MDNWKELSKSGIEGVVRKYEKKKNKNNPALPPEDPFADYNNYENRIQEEASKFRTQTEGARKQGQKEAQDLINNPPPGLTDKEKESMRTERKSQIQKDLMNYNRMLSGQHSVRGVRGGVANAQTRNLQNAANESVNQYERELAELDYATRRQNMAAIFAGGEGAAAQEALINQMAWDRIMGHLQNKEQSKLNKTAQQYFNKI